VLALEMADRRMTLQAYVVLNEPSENKAETAALLKDYVKKKLLPYKYPRTVVFLDSLPKTGTGKIDRQALKASDLSNIPRVTCV
jgi:acyl-coenzyme A synthetase/AMP-(fatty) acid ligase